MESKNDLQGCQFYYDVLKVCIVQVTNLVSIYIVFIGLEGANDHHPVLLPINEQHRNAEQSIPGLKRVKVTCFFDTNCLYARMSEKIKFVFLILNLNDMK